MGSLDRLSTSADRLSGDASAIIGRRSETPSVSGTSTSAPRRQSSNQVSGGGENGTSSPGRRRSEMLRESLSTPTSTGLTHSTSNASNIAEGSGNSGVLPRRRSTVTEEGAPAVKQQQLPPQLEDYNVHAVRPQSILSTVSSSSPQPVANIRSTESTLLNPTRSQYEPKRPSVSQKPTSPPPPVRHGSIAVELLQQQQQQQQQDWEELVPNGLDIGYITELGDHFNWRRRLFRVRNRALQLYSLDPVSLMIEII
jgi:hypothetical protein